MIRALRSACLVALLLAACVEKPREMSASDEEARKQIVSRTAPTPAHPLSIDFEGKLRLVGYDLDVKTAREGQPFKVTWYWYVEHPPGTGWKLFTHLADAQKKSRLNLDGTRISRRVYPLELWKKGEYVKDVQEITLPADWNSPQAIFYLGAYKDDRRLHVTEGASDGEHRAEALVLAVAGGSAAESPTPTLPRLIARHVSSGVVVDGKLDEAEWAATQSTGPFVNTMKGTEGAFIASARVLYGPTHLYFGFEVKDSFLASKFEQRDDRLWEQDAVEMLIDPDGDGKNYFEIQVSPRGTVFDTLQQAPRTPKPFGVVAWSSDVEAKVVLDGTLDDDAEDVGYSVEVAFPWPAFVSGGAPTPPKGGDVWRVNLFVLDATKDGQRAVGWSPPMIGDFHTPARFGRLAFPRPALTVPPPAEAPVAAPAPTKAP